MHDVMAPVSTAQPWLTAEWLTSRLFAFRAGPERTLLAPALRFERNGRISGYAHPNETGWKLEDGKLFILTYSGAPSCIADPVTNANGTISFNGKFLLFNSESIHRFEEIPAMEGLPAVCTFDLFDTLVARRCHEPLVIFELVETKSGLPGFATARRAAEVGIWHQDDYGFDDIYTALGANTGWPEPVLERLKMLELAEEWDHLFPIKEVVDRVGPDDIIISDMYLPHAFLCQVVHEKCGLPGRPVHVSAHGKSRGHIWPKIAATNRVIRHHGDNWGSDVESARCAGHDAEHIGISAWTRSETIMGDSGLGEIAKVIRETRLASFDRDPRLQGVRMAQVAINVPVLILASLDILRLARERGVDTLLMCSRDCNLWLKLMQWMAPRSQAAPIVRYLIASRVLFLSESPEYDAYFSRTRGQRNMLIDVTGTGKSPSHFIGHIQGQKHTSVYMLTAKKNDSANFVNDMVVLRDDIEIDILSEQPFDIRYALECLNVSLDGRAHRMRFNGQTIEIEKEANEFGLISQSMIAAMRDVFLNFTRNLEASNLRRVDEDIPPATLQSAVTAIASHAAHYLQLLGPISADISREEQRVADVAQLERKKHQERRKPPPSNIS